MSKLLTFSFTKEKVNLLIKMPQKQANTESNDDPYLADHYINYIISTEINIQKHVLYLFNCEYLVYSEPEEYSNYLQVNLHYKPWCEWVNKSDDQFMILIRKS